MRPRSRHSGQAMVEMAIGVAIFLLATLGVVQIGLLALAQQGTQSAALTGLRVGSAAPPLAGDPLERLLEGRLAAAAALQQVEVGMAQVESCAGEEAAACGVGGECERYRDGSPQPGTEMPCAAVPLTSTAATVYGPLPEYLDGSQNQGCRSGSCFGASTAMASCASAAKAGELRICLAYTSWPARAVDIWITGTLRTFMPWVGSAGLDLEPVAVRLRLQVEALSP